ncbi:transaldolase family protein [Butyricicoccus faecihominis]|uniref:transaldolase family protein n=1 Tax=Butyricicoccus faecihominis TaxID=1712515 RepID=UPI002478A7E4|nr:transaldolase family protein [Butyricicoccus faecihominis]
MISVSSMKITLGALVASGKLKVDPNTPAQNWRRIEQLEVAFGELEVLTRCVGVIGVTQEFEHVIETFHPADGVIPAGFRPAFEFSDDGSARVDLIRDISYGENGHKRPTRVLFSADSANPYEVAPIKNFVANLTCNPAIIYNSFINNPAANVGNKFKNRQEVMRELCSILGPGVDISVEIDNPFAPRSEILEEVAEFEEILTPYRLVVKVPHTGPITADSADKLIAGAFEKGFEDGTVDSNFYGHNLAYFLEQHGYRTNFTLMFEPHQTALALQAKPYFINTFLKQRFFATDALRSMLHNYSLTNDMRYAEAIRNYMRKEDMLSPTEVAGPIAFILEKAERTIAYRHAQDSEGADGLDATRHSLRVLRASNLPDTRLIICSMGGELLYPSIDKMLTEPEFEDMVHRVVVTAPPAYLSRFASASGVLTYQKLFLNAAK